VGNGVGARLLLAIKQPLEIELAQVAHACVANEFSGRAHKPPHSKTNTLITCPCRGSANCKLQLPQGGYLQQSPPPTSTQQLPHGPPSAPPWNSSHTPAHPLPSCPTHLHIPGGQVPQVHPVHPVQWAPVGHQPAAGLLVVAAAPGAGGDVHRVRQVGLPGVTVQWWCWWW
jgi:hypothetical protein